MCVFSNGLGVVTPLKRHKSSRMLRCRRSLQTGRTTTVPEKLIELAAPEAEYLFFHFFLFLWFATVARPTQPQLYRNEGDGPVPCSRLSVLRMLSGAAAGWLTEAGSERQSSKAV